MRNGGDNKREEVASVTDRVLTHGIGGIVESNFELVPICAMYP